MAQIERTLNATRNIIVGVLLKIYQIIVPFLMRTAIIYFLGVQYLGLNSLFVSILSVLNMAELGVGSAMVYSMYKPIAEDDTTTICALMKLYRTYYRAIGLIIAIVGCALTPFIPYLISNDIPGDLNIYILYLLNLAATVLSYWLYAYKSSILQAYQRVDIVSRVTILTNTVQYILQLGILWATKNYYLYVIVLLITQVLTNIIIAIEANRIYPQYKAKGQVPGKVKTAINCHIKDLFTAKIGGVIYDSADTIVISAFLGLTMLAIYQNYFFVLNAITGLIAVIFSACTAGIGNSIVVETKDKNYNDLVKFTFIICWVAGFCSVSLLCLYQPFMNLWVGKKYMLSFSAVICFVIYFFVRQINSLLNLYKDASGIWHVDRFRPLIAALVNLVLNLILVQFIGIYGILISTVLAILCVGMPWLIHNLFTVIFDSKNLSLFLKKLGFYCTVVFVSCVVSYGICSFVHCGAIITLLLRGIICCVIPNLIYYFAYRRTREYQGFLTLVNNMTRGKIKGVLRKLGMS